MSGHILLDNQVVEARDEAPRVPPFLWILLAGAGAVATTLGLADVAAIWIGADLGNVDWEFAAIEATFATLLVTTTGLALLGAGLLGHEFRMASKLVAIFLIGMGSFLAGLLVIYLVDAPGVAQSNLATGKPAPETVKTAIIGSVYIVLYFWGVWFLRTRAKRMPLVTELPPEV